jgi:hypothetical protein
MQNYILYNVKNNTQSINECRYSLLKLLSLYNLQVPATTGIVIYTSHPEAFEAYSSFFSLFELMEESTEALSKVDLIQNFFRYADGNLLYMDTDTYPLQLPDELFKKIEVDNKILLFQKRNSPKKLKDFVINNHIIFDGREINFLDEKELYTAEIVGCNHLAMPTLHKAADLHVQLKEGITQKMAEAFTFSYSTSEYSRETTEKEFACYRHFPEFKNLLETFFKRNEEESIPNLVKLVHHLDAVTIEKEKLRYQSLPFFKKMIQSIIGKAWSLRRYQNKF